MKMIGNNKHKNKIMAKFAMHTNTPWMKIRTRIENKASKKWAHQTKTQENTSTKWNAWKECALNGEVNCLLKLLSSNLELTFWQLQKSKISNWFTFKASCAQEYH
jgi:UPF0288 family protein (methanogenesis marker protein 3)